MTITKKIIFPLALTIISYLIGLFLLNRLPETMITHWGLYGEPNGYSSKAFGTFFPPVLLTILLPIFLLLPKTDPYKQNFTQFQSHYYNFISLVFAFLFYIYLLTIVYNLGYKFDMLRFLIPAFSLLFFFISFLLSVAKRNWFVGIRTPWTMADDQVWTSTHLLGSKLFKAAALVGLLGLVIPNLAFFLIIVPILSVTAILFVYSYVIYKRISINNRQ